jgi:hypothetical protein
MQNNRYSYSFVYFKEMQVKIIVSFHSVICLAAIDLYLQLMNIKPYESLEVLCFNWAPRFEGLLEEWRYSSTHSWPGP